MSIKKNILSSLSSATLAKILDVVTLVLEKTNLSPDASRLYISKNCVENSQSVMEFLSKLKLFGFNDGEDVIGENDHYYSRRSRLFVVYPISSDVLKSFVLDIKNYIKVTNNSHEEKELKNSSQVIVYRASRGSDGEVLINNVVIKRPHKNGINNAAYEYILRHSKDQNTTIDQIDIKNWIEKKKQKHCEIRRLSKVVDGLGFVEDFRRVFIEQLDDKEGKLIFKINVTKDVLELKKIKPLKFKNKLIPSLDI